MNKTLEPGARLGRYRLLVELGRGGMASVWVALEQGPSGAQRLVALKVMLPRLASQSSFRSMFLDEGQIVRSIEHENVVRIFEVGEDRGLLFMAMEWVEGDSLHALIKEARKRRPIPAEMAVRVIADIARGLHEAHELRGWDGELRGLVHCDVSPHNILIGVDGRSKLVDFGVAHAAAISDEDRTGQVRGKLGYMSPEQVRAGSIDRRSDVFALGIVAYELTTGKRLFGRRDPQETAALVRAARVPPPSAVLDGYPAGLQSVILRALQRDPDRRFQTAAEFAQALESYLVDARTLVSHASVARLLTRVLGDRIRERREFVETSLRKLGERFAPATLPIPEHEHTTSIPIGKVAPEVDSGAYEVHTTTASRPYSSRPSQGSVSPHIVESFPAASRRRLAVVGSIAGGAAIVAAVAWVWPRSSPANDEPVAITSALPVQSPNSQPPIAPASPGSGAGASGSDETDQEGSDAERPEPVSPTSLPPRVAAPAPPPVQPRPPVAPQTPTATSDATFGPGPVPPAGDDLGIDNPYR